ncbi:MULTISPECIES: type II toxin-antitoxin system VapB family antitoxin [Thermodesulfovibrio]|uniref:type II toxin-antitoxin system VapB family antitoxin n=1 Tax=Thermodesulfovibrio TaxID=28261 RepID=UPI002614542D|nr:type II toxin-antitoxin system CcdA family antitoxin [Thermodesulfovibrio sp.]
MNTEVISIRVDKKTKEKMKELKINWSEFIKEAIREKIKQEERKKLLERSLQILEKTASSPKNTAASMIRNDRDSR